MNAKSNLKKNVKKTLEILKALEKHIGGFSIGGEMYKIEKQLETLSKNLSKKTFIVTKEFYDEQYDKVLPEILDKINARLDKINNKPSEIELQNKIIEKANLIGGFITFKLNNNTKFKVAKIPFLIWCIGDTPYQHGKEKGDILYDVRTELENLWGETISYSGEKLPNDNVYHSEWIRSAKISPKDYYQLVEQSEDKEWIHSFVFRYEMMYQHYLFENKDKPLECIDVIDSNVKAFDYLFKKFSNQNDNKELYAIPYHYNPKTSFPIYFKPVYQEKLDSSDLEKIGTRFLSVIVRKSDESVNEIALNMSNSINGVIFTNNPSKTAHLINVAEDINLNIFYLPKDINLEDDTTIYSLQKDGKIELITCDKSYSSSFIPLQECQGFKNIVKTSNLAILKNNGFNVPNGFWSNGAIPKFKTKTQMIARSSGIGEGSKKARFSGIFKSKLLDMNSIDDNKTIIREVMDSFKSNIATKYAEKMKVSVPRCGVLYQEYIEADFSYVVKVNEKSIYIEKTIGEASKLVNGEIIPMVYEYHINDKVNDNYIDIIAMIKDIKQTLKETNLELEIVEKNKLFYIIQAI